ncbi:MAG: acetoin utilization protein AcuC [Anaerolineae bacterium]
MSGRTALIYHERYSGRGTSPISQAWLRYQQTWDLVEELGMFDNGLLHYRPEPATDEDLLRAHTPGYLQQVMEADVRGYGFLDYGDTPAYPGVDVRSRLAVGGTLLAARRIAGGTISHAFNPAGGLHHARSDRAGGFCVFNDIVIAARTLRDEGLDRIAIVDIDGHHADGTQALLYDEPILKISVHMYDRLFYPGTGAVAEVGRGPGEGYSVNIPLRRRTGNSAYRQAFDEIVVPVLRDYQPQFIINQFGVDAHYQDPLVGLWLTTDAFRQIAETLHNLAHELCEGRLLVLGGGGYDPRNVARCWTIMLGTISGAVPEESQADFEALFDTEGPRTDDRAEAQVQKVIQEVKRRIFPLRGLSEHGSR